MRRSMIGLAVLVSLWVIRPAYATPPCNLGPLDSVTEWINFFPNDEGLPIDEITNCEKVCGSWVKTCKSLAKLSAKCFVQSFAQVAILFRAECGTQAVKTDRTDCKNSVKGLVVEQKTNITANLVLALAACDANKGPCLTKCITDPP